MKRNKILVNKPLTRETVEVTAPEGVEVISAKGFQTYNPVTGRDHVELDVNAVDRRKIDRVDCSIDTSHLPQPRYEAGAARDECAFDTPRACARHGCLAHKLEQYDYINNILAEDQTETIETLNAQRSWGDPKIVGVAMFDTIDFDHDTVTIKNVVVIAD